MSRMEPVAWRKENPAFARYDGNGYVPVRYLWTHDINTANGEAGWVPVYTADQVRSMVEQVRGEIRGAKPFSHPDAAIHAATFDAGGLAALDAILAQLDADPPTTNRT